MTICSISIEGISVLVYRDDLNHAVVSGNKLHKLAPNIELAKAQNNSTVLSFGGPYSNHLHALAWACREAGLSSIGVIRGELHEDLTPTLEDCKKWGMTLIPSQRNDYRQYRQILEAIQTPCLASELDLPAFSNTPNSTLVIPEGGSNSIAIKSVASAYRSAFKLESTEHVTHAVCATGTGATLAGLYTATPNHVKVIGVQAVAEGQATLNRIHDWVDVKSNELSIKEGHLGGFGKRPAELMTFIEEFEASYHIPLDPIYNGKAMFKIVQMIRANEFKKTDQILFFHTGGLQGKR